jgi:hypothetical protein
VSKAGRQRALHVDEQHDTLRIAVVPHFMRMAVVENHALPFFPEPHIFPNPDPRTPYRFRDNQPEVIAKDTLPQSSVFWDMLSRCKN